MTEVTISPKYQVVIPKKIREAMGLRAGQKVQVLTFGDRIELIPLKPISSLKGILKGINTNVERDNDRL